tara:strand:- start:1046 stop:1249 length:204 start_codon:yes stop_codon:yes gene_type:complete
MMAYMNTTWTDQQRGAFWKKDGKNGKYLAGYIIVNGKKMPVTVFPNKYKSKDNQPEFIIYETFGQNG